MRIQAESQINLEQHYRDSEAPTTDVSEPLRTRFSETAENPAAFAQLLSQVYGDSYDPAAAERLRQSALQNDYTWLPNVEYVPGGSLHGAAGAYNEPTHTIFINEDFKGTATAEQVYIEEVGHHIDGLIKSTDTQGDEGALFSATLQDVTLTRRQVQQLRMEDDHGQINVDGKLLNVEFKELESDAGSDSVSSEPPKRQLESEEIASEPVPAHPPKPQLESEENLPILRIGRGKTMTLIP